VPDAASLARLGQRWSKLVQFSHDPNVDPVRAGLPTGGVVLVRPDGHIGFRSPSAEAGALAALDRHLSSYLVPDPTLGPVDEATVDLVDHSLTSRQLPKAPANA
jgi:hypothetical protein